jgi:hypothetical protein
MHVESRYARSHLEGLNFEDHQFVVNAAVRHECHMVAPKMMPRVISLVKEVEAMWWPIISEYNLDLLVPLRTGLGGKILARFCFEDLRNALPD